MVLCCCLGGGTGARIAAMERIHRNVIMMLHLAHHISAFPIGKQGGIVNARGGGIEWIALFLGLSKESTRGEDTEVPLNCRLI